jgi:hypothetical protein
MSISDILAEYSKEFGNSDQEDIDKFVNENIGIFKKFKIEKAGDIFDSDFEDLFKRMDLDMTPIIEPLIGKFLDQMKKINKRMFDLYLPDSKFLVNKALCESLRNQNVMNQTSIGKFKYYKHVLDFTGDTYDGLLIKHEGVTMLFTYAYEPYSGSFKLKNGTKLKINCYKSNWLRLDLYGLMSIFGVSEHLDKIGDAGF